MYSKHRLEMLSDAVFAIAMTLLILDLKAPTDVAPGQLVSTLMHEKSSYLSLVLTFMLSASMWAFQHRLFEVTESIDKVSLVLTFIFLGGVSILPFSTSLLSHYYSADPAASVFYVGVLFLTSSSLSLQYEWSRWKRHLHPDRASNSLRLELFAGAVFMGYAIVILRSTYPERNKVFLLLGAVLISPLVRRLSKFQFSKTFQQIAHRKRTTN
jgi:uncharacterized membrane protein